MRLELAVKKLLEGAGVRDVYTAPPSVCECVEPVVVGRGTFEREERMEDCEHGAYALLVLVVRESAAEAYRVAADVERILHMSDWESAAVEGVRINGMDAQAPVFEKRDSSGRHVCKVAVTVAATREV